MEFGNLKDIIYLALILLGAIATLLGIVKKKKIMELLSLGVPKRSEYIKGGLLVIGGLLIFIALLAPEKLESEKEVKREGLSLYILMDISRSMLAEDVYPSRIEAAKRSVREIIKNLRGDRVGIIPFSDSAYIQMPLTDDYSIAENYISVIDTKLISGGGTDIKKGLQLANSSYTEINSQNKVVLIISDGGEEEKGTIEFAKDNNIKVYTMGIGTKDGSVLPNYEYGKKNGFIRDKKGATVISRLNRSFLEKIAEKTGGNYYEINNLSRSEDIFIEDLARVDREDIKQENIRVYTHYYQYPLFLGLLLILIGINLRGGIKDEED